MPRPSPSSPSDVPNTPGVPNTPDVPTTPEKHVPSEAPVPATTPSAAPRPWLPDLRSPVVAAVIDAVLVLVFAAIGRASHAEQNPVVGAVSTAMPFLVGGALGWALVWWRSHRWAVDLGPGIVVWVATVVVGMLLRAVVGQGTAASFIVVATLFLGAVLLGWRYLAGRFGPAVSRAG